MLACETVSIAVLMLGIDTVRMGAAAVDSKSPTGLPPPPLGPPRSRAGNNDRGGGTTQWRSRGRGLATTAAPLEVVSDAAGAFAAAAAGATSSTLPSAGHDIRCRLGARAGSRNSPPVVDGRGRDGCVGALPQSPRPPSSPRSMVRRGGSASVSGDTPDVGVTGTSDDKSGGSVRHMSAPAQDGGWVPAAAGPAPEVEALPAAVPAAEPRPPPLMSAFPARVGTSPVAGVVGDDAT